MEDITDVDDFSLLDPSPDVHKYLFESMFASICHQFTCDAGKNTLIPSPSLHEAKQLLPLNVVTMKQRRNRIVSDIPEYSIYDMPLTDLFIGQPVVGLQVVESKYCSHNSDNTYSLNCNIGGNMIHIIDSSVGTACDNTITCKLGDLLERKIGYSNFMSAIKERKLDMNHPFIREIKDTQQIMCVIRGVIATSEKAEIKCTNNKDDNINVSARKLRRILGGVAAIGRIVGSDRAMGIEPGTTLAYDVWELKVDVDSGEITPIMTTYLSGGFFNGGIRNLEKCSVKKFYSFEENTQRDRNSEYSKDAFSIYNKCVVIIHSHPPPR